MLKYYFIFLSITVIVMCVVEALKDYHATKLQEICLVHHTPKECAEK